MMTIIGGLCIRQRADGWWEVFNTSDLRVGVWKKFPSHAEAVSWIINGGNR